MSNEELENEEQVIETVETEEERLFKEEQERLAKKEQEERERLQREEQERKIAENEEARLRAIQEHEALLSSFPETTVFYHTILENADGSKSLGMPMNVRQADGYGCLDKHYDLSELTYVGNETSGIYYLKGYEKPEKPLEELQLDRYRLIDSQIEAYLDAKVKEHNYKSVESCVSYYNSTDDKYRAEARAVSTWRDHIYHTGEQVWQSVLNGLVDYRDVDLNYIINIAGDFSWETNV